MITIKEENYSKLKKNYTQIKEDYFKDSLCKHTILKAVVCVTLSIFPRKLGVSAMVPCERF